MLTHEEARRVYDRIGSLQDSQAFYENRATELILEAGEFAAAEAVFEFGCGTGRLAERLLAEFLPVNCAYRGVDVSPRMVDIARQRLGPFSSRSDVVLTDGGPPVDEPPGSCDRFLSTYVFDLLTDDDIHRVMENAYRMIRPNGLLCLASLSTGTDRFTRAISGIWGWIQAQRPSAVGGCRPIDLLPFLPPADWDIHFHDKVAALGVTSEVLMARPITLKHRASRTAL